MSLIQGKAYIGLDRSITYDELSELEPTALIICASDDIVTLLRVLMSVVRGKHDFSAVVLAEGVYASTIPSDLKPQSITIFSSGTTGTPKASTMTWRSMLHRVTKRVQSGEYLASGYDVNRFAGIQALLACLSNKATYLDVGNNFKLLEHYVVDRLVGTPSWTLFLLQHFGAGVSRTLGNLKSVTLGGEAASASLLQRLSFLFPSIEIVQIYASSESGVLFSVKDKLPGVKVNDAHRMEVEGRLAWTVCPLELTENGLTELIYTYQDVEEVSRPSGDLFRKVKGRLIFFGRKGDCINVGGHNISTSELERFVNQYSNILLSRVSFRNSSLIGNILTLEIVLRDPSKPFEKGGFIKKIRETLGDRYIPASVKIVNRIELNSNGKVSRL